jgi:hypothetical protein
MKKSTIWTVAGALLWLGILGSVINVVIEKPQQAVAQTANGGDWTWLGYATNASIVTASGVTSTTYITRTPMKIWSASASAVTNVSAVTFIVDTSMDNFTTSTAALTVTKAAPAGTTGVTFLPGLYYRVRCTGYVGAAGPVTNATCTVWGQQ